jgi:hypothetical protein
MPTGLGQQGGRGPNGGAAPRIASQGSPDQADAGATFATPFDTPTDVVYRVVEFVLDEFSAIKRLRLHLPT